MKIDGGIDPIGIEHLYAHVAPFYADQVIPAFGPLAENLADWIVDCLGAHQHGKLYDPFELESSIPIAHPVTSLDLGTGTGILAGALMTRKLPTIGLDLSIDMLRQAENLPHRLVVNIHDLPIRRHAVGLIVSSFGLNTTRPRRSLHEIMRVLRPGGLFIAQEWGVEDPLSNLFESTLEEFIRDDVADLGEIDPALHEFYNTPNPWYAQLEDSSDYYHILKRIGFELVWVKEAEFTAVRFGSVSAFIDSKMAWPSRRLPFQRLPATSQELLLQTLQQRLNDHINADGSLDWRPSLFRICAVNS